MLRLPVGIMDNKQLIKSHTITRSIIQVKIPKDQPHKMSAQQSKNLKLIKLNL